MYILPPGLYGLIEQAGVVGWNLDSQRFFPSGPDMDGVQLAALYTLQHGLAGYAEVFHGLVHCHITGRRLLHEPETGRLVDSDAPGSAGSDLFAIEEAVVEPTMDGRGGHPEDFRGFADGDEGSVIGPGRRVEAGDFPVAAEVADALDREPESLGGGFSLAAEDGGDDVVGVELGEAADQVDGVLVGPDSALALSRAVQLDFRQAAGAPVNSQRPTVDSLGLSEYIPGHAGRTSPV